MTGFEISILSSSSPTWGPLPCVSTRRWPAPTRSASGGKLTARASNHSLGAPTPSSERSALPPMATTTRLTARRPAPEGGAHDAGTDLAGTGLAAGDARVDRSEEHTSELQSRPHLVCRLLLEKKKKKH